MQPFQANILNSIVLIALGIWGYIDSSAAANALGTSLSPTVFIAPVAGLILLALTSGIKKDNKIIAHIAVLLTLLLILALFMPFLKREGIAQIRVGIMILAGAFALLTFIKSFIKARNA